MDFKMNEEIWRGMSEDIGMWCEGCKVMNRMSDNVVRILCEREKEVEQGELAVADRNEWISVLNA